MTSALINIETLPVQNKMRMTYAIYGVEFKDYVYLSKTKGIEGVGASGPYTVLDVHDVFDDNTDEWHLQVCFEMPLVLARDPK
jgi:hypothetical protein